MGCASSPRVSAHPPSRVLRRLIREAINGGPDFFREQHLDFRMVARHVAAIGRRLNTLARAANRGQVLGGAEVQETVNAARVEVAAVAALYYRAVAAASWRAWPPLHLEAGLPWPFGKTADDTAAGRWVVRQPSRRPLRFRRRRRKRPA